ncbi:MAG: regulatory protein RecX [Solirubrobacteraceae bacterium]
MGSDQAAQHALELACSYLNRRDRTVSEVRSQLEHKAVSGAVIEQCLQALVEQGLVDDARYAQLFVADKRELEQWGSERIRRGLLARGVDRELIDAALTPVTADDAEAEGPEDTELGRALEVLRRRYPSPPVDRRERERALGLLLRKGYENELALDALASYARGG